jgi:natural product biosynthesis luciferase-like monooxygenase protein
VDFSLFFFADSGAAGGEGYRLLLDSARFADANDFTAVWTPERHFHSFGGLYPNPAVTGAAVAAVTRRIGVRAGSVVAPLHHPIRIAEEWSVVDNLSNGRVAVSFASGWHAVDFALRPENYMDRRRVLADSVATVRRLWRGEELEVSDGTGEKRSVRVFPAPVQPELPVWITSSGTPDTFRLAGQLRAGVLTHLLTQDQATLARNIAAYRNELWEAHQQLDGRVALMLHTMLGADRDRVREVVREPFGQYLRSSADLVVKAIADLLPAGFDPSQLSEADKDHFIGHVVDRHLTSTGLFGTVEDGVETVRRLQALGVDEVACLVDYGVPYDEVMQSLRYLAELRDRTAGDGVDALLARTDAP